MQIDNTAGEARTAVIPPAHKKPVRSFMNRRTFLKAASLSGLAAGAPTTAVFGYDPQRVSQEQVGANSSKQEHQLSGESPEQILLKDYRPKSIYKIPVTEIAKARYPIIDMHSHPYAKTPEQIAEWVNNMDEGGLKRRSFSLRP
jgi:hypothetical protein